MTRFVSLLVLVVGVSSSLYAVEPSLGSLALAVREPDPILLTQVVTAGFGSSDPAIRALAARVANVRKLDATVGPLRQLLTTETSAEVAREEIRAVVMLGGAAEIDAAIAASARFDHRLDGTVVTAAARAGIPDILSVYLSKLVPLQSLGDDGNFFKLAFWGRPQLAGPAASILLGRRDEVGWNELLGAIRDSGTDLTPDAVRAALASNNATIIRSTLLYLTKLGKVRAYQTEIDTASSDDVGTSFAIELARRAAGEPKRSNQDWVEYLREEQPRQIFDSQEVRELLTKDELAVQPAPGKGLLPTRSVMKIKAEAAPYRAAYSMPTLLPAGVGDAVMGVTKCGTGFWIGLAPSSVDSGGRVISLDPSRIVGANGCRTAAEVLSRLSLVTNDRFDTPFSMHDVLLVRGVGAPVCLDERPVAAATREVARGGRVEPPIPTYRTEAVFSREAQARLTPEDSVVILEAFITREGCVRGVRILKPSHIADLNSASALAVTNWRFKPGTVDGEPVDVAFSLTMNFKNH